MDGLTKLNQAIDNLKTAVMAEFEKTWVARKVLIPFMNALERQLKKLFGN